MKVNSLSDSHASMSYSESTPSPFASAAQPVEMGKAKIDFEDSSEESKISSESSPSWSPEEPATMINSSQKPASQTQLTAKTQQHNPVEVLHMTIEERIRRRGADKPKPIKKSKEESPMQATAERDFYQEFLKKSKIKKEQEKKKAGERKKAKGSNQFKAEKPYQTMTMIGITKSSAKDTTSIINKAATTMFN